MATSRRYQSVGYRTKKLLLGPAVKTSQLARQVLGGGPAFLLVQAATLLILVLAATTAFSGFPLLASFASGDALLPRQLRKRGHRLVYSNGIIALSAVAIVLLVAFKADTHSLIPLYAVGVVISFTLAQAGMTRRHRRLREPGWRRGILINGRGWLLLRIQRTYSRELNPLTITALHVAVDPDHARELGRLWAKVHIPFPLEVVDAPDRNLLAAVEEAVAERVRSDTEVTVLVPRRRFVGFCAGSCTTRPRPA